MWIVCMADNSHEMSRLIFSENWQTIHMKCQDLFFSEKEIFFYFECRLLQILLGALRVNWSYVVMTNKQTPETLSIWGNIG